MSIYFITGKPRGGKSLYSVHLLVKELVHGHRPIVTNLALNLPVLNEYLQKTYPHKSIDLHKRVRLINDDEVRQFWLYGPWGPPLQDLTKEQWACGKFLDFSPIMEKAPEGIMYCIDEIHTILNAREWMRTGPSCLYWASQHAKMSQDLIAITQVIGNVDKQFRSLSQNFTVVKNLRKSRLGMFRMPPAFLRQTFFDIPNGNATAEETGMFRLDVSGLASCYDTAKGVGIHGNKADKGEKQRGLPLWVLALCVALLVLFILKVPGSLAAMYFRKVMPKAPAAAPAVPAKISQPTSRGTNATSAVKPHESVREQSARADATNEVYMSWLASTGKSYHIGLSDGRVYTQSDVEAIGTEGCIIRGKYYRFNHQVPSMAELEKLMPKKEASKSAEYESYSEPIVLSTSRVRVAPAVVWDAEFGRPR